MNTNNYLKEQIEKEKTNLKYINLWFIEIIPINLIIWTLDLIFKTKLNTNVITTPAILFSTGTILGSGYLLIFANKFKQNIKSLNHKLYILETNNELNKKEHEKSNNISKLNIKKNDYSYKPNKFYNNQNININTLKNYKVKRRVLKNSNIHTTKKSD